MIRVVHCIGQLGHKPLSLHVSRQEMDQTISYHIDDDVHMFLISLVLISDLML